ncbi:MAG: iron-sulfur cluster assembly accessory protein [Alphaproteobacteria bacterium]
MVKITFEAAETAPPIPQTGTPFIVTDAAAAQLAVVLAKRPVGTCLRIRVTGGGCNGYNYHLKLNTDHFPDDHVVEKNGGIVRIDAQSLALLWGSTLAFEDTIESSQFIINNPHATSSCGCGNSFGL